MSMLKRTIEVSGWGYQLTGRGKHLRLAKGGEEVGAVPFEDLGVLIGDLQVPNSIDRVSALLLCSGGPESLADMRGR